MLDRSLKVRDQAKTRLNDLYAMAVLIGMTSQEINEAKSKILADMPAKTPHWVRAYLSGYERALSDRLYDSVLVHGGLINGVFYSTHSNRPDYYGKHSIDACDFADDGLVKERGHYWPLAMAWRGGTYTRDKVKPYFISQ